MSSVPASNKSPLDALHQAFSQDQIDDLRTDDLTAGYRVSGVLITVIGAGCLIGILGVLLSIW